MGRTCPSYANKRRAAERKFDLGHRTMAKAKKKTIRTIPQKRTPVREQDPKQRVKNFGEVNCG